MKFSDQEQKLAERIGGGKITDRSDRMVLAIGFVLERRSNPTVPLVEYQRTHTADQVREEHDLPAKKAPAKKAAGGKK